MNRTLIDWLNQHLGPEVQVNRTLIDWLKQQLELHLPVNMALIDWLKQQFKAAAVSEQDSNWLDSHWLITATIKTAAASEQDSNWLVEAAIRPWGASEQDSNGVAAATIKKDKKWKNEIQWWSQKNDQDRHWAWRLQTSKASQTS